MSTHSPHAATIRSASVIDVPGISRLLARAVQGSGGQVLVPGRSKPGSERIMRTKALDGCLLLAEQQGKLAGLAGLDLDRAAVSELVIGTTGDRSALARVLLERAEKLALAFGVLELQVVARTRDVPWFHSRGYHTKRTSPEAGPVRDAESLAVLARSLRRRQTRYARLLVKISQELGIPVNYGQQHRLQLQPEAGNLRSIGLDVFGREQWMAPRAAAAWQRMRQGATQKGVELQAVSAWRSVEYQCGLLQRKLAKGLSIDAILQVSAAPGYSEHHTGRAIDITSPGCTVLSEEFAHSPAFRWLQRHAPGFGFRLSFPRKNRHKLAFEPWHWCFCN